MSLNIKSPEAHELARELAERTGESMTEAVTVALRERLARVGPTEQQIRAKKEVIMALAHDIASRMGPEYRAIDHIADLYDEETGLPR